MRPFPLLMRADEFRIGWQMYLAGLFPHANRREDAGKLTPHPKRDIGLKEQHQPDRNRPPK